MYVIKHKASGQFVKVFHVQEHTLGVDPRIGHSILSFSTDSMMDLNHWVWKIQQQMNKDKLAMERWFDGLPVFTVDFEVVQMEALAAKRKDSLTHKSNR